MSHTVAKAKAESNPGIDGIGFVLTDSDPFIGWDFDDVIDEQGNITEWATEAIARLDSYTEYSPSKEGLHTLSCGFRPGNRTTQEFDDGSKIETFDSRFITITGDHLAGTPTTVTVGQQPIDDVYGDLYGDCDAHPDSVEDTDSQAGSDIPAHIWQQVEDVDVTPTELNSNKIGMMEAHIRDFHADSDTSKRAIKGRHQILEQAAYRYMGFVTSNGKTDRSKAETFAVGLLITINERYGDGQEADLDAVAHYMTHVCNETPETSSEGLPRKWNERGANWRRGLLASAIKNHEPEAFDHWQSKQYRSEWDFNDEYSDITYSVVWNAVIELADEGASRTDIVTLAQENDDRSKESYRTALSRLVNDHEQVKMVHCGGNDYRYLPAHYDDPPEAERVKIGGGWNEPEQVQYIAVGDGPQVIKAQSPPDLEPPERISPEEEAALFEDKHTQHRAYDTHPSRPPSGVRRTRRKNPSRSAKDGEGVRSKKKRRTVGE